MDVHSSGGDTYGKNDELSLLEEIKLILRSGKRCAILIVDARLFLAPPPGPHDASVWPTIRSVMEELPSGWEAYVYEDVIY